MAYPDDLVGFRGPLLVRYDGVFDWDGLYLLIVEWLKSRKFKVDEKVFKHKVPDPFGAEQESTINAEQKVTGYYKYSIKIDYHLWHLKEVDINVNGQIKKLFKGRLEIRLTGGIHLDYEKRFEKSAFTKKLKEFYHRYIIKEEIEGPWADTLYYRLNKLQAVIKKFLDMQTKHHEYKGYLGEY